MKWLVTGAAGQLGHHVEHRLGVAGDDVVALTRAEFDITSASDVETAITQHRPDIVVNTAAYTAVDAAETDEDTALLVNGIGPELLAEALARHGGRLLHVSTDYVFDGTARAPYEPDDQVGPRSAYGRTKLAGERAVRSVLPVHSHVVRTAWVYGGPGPNFVDTMRRLEGERDTVDVVSDQLGSPTWAGDLAAALIELGRAQLPGGVLHYACAGTASWFDLAQETFRLAGADPARVHPVGTGAFPRPAPRPAWSVLSSRAWIELGLTAPRPWQDALADAFVLGVT